MLITPSTEEYRAPWWLPGGHAQTLWRKYSAHPKVDHDRQRIELPDGDFIDLDWAGPRTAPDWSNTLVFILHGLCGCSRSPYMQAAQARLESARIASVVMNFRGCSGEVNRLAKAYHSGISDDVETVFETLRSQHPGRRFVAVGFSLGANVLLKWLGERGADSPVQRAIAVSTPFDLAACSQAMTRGFTRLYGLYFVRRLVADLQRKRAAFIERQAYAELRLLDQLGGLVGIRSIWEFDDRITAPLHGFHDAADYYRHCSSQEFLSANTTDTVLIQSLNDPLIPAEVLPDPVSLRSNFSVRYYPSGGHVGFVDQRDGNWLENRIVEYAAV